MVFGHTVKHMMRSVVVCQSATDIEAVAIPLVIIFGNSEDVVDCGAEYPVALSSSTPQAEVCKGDDYSVHLLVEVHPLIGEIAVDHFRPNAV